jgi:hypothetical protein
LFPPPLAAKADEKFKDFAPGYRRTYYAGVHHGFASHGDLVRPCIFSYPEIDPTSPRAEQRDGKGRQGRRVQVDCGMVYQISVVKDAGFVLDMRSDDLCVGRCREPRCKLNVYEVVYDVVAVEITFDQGGSFSCFPSSRGYDATVTS